MNYTHFLNDEEKMKDFLILSKEEFLKSYSYLTEEEYDLTRDAYSKSLCPVLKSRLVDDGEIMVGTAKQISDYLKDIICEEMKEIPSLGWGFMDDGDFHEHLKIASELDKIWMNEKQEGLYKLELWVGAKWDIEKLDAVYTWDDLYVRADGKAFGSDELDAKDEARWQIGGYIKYTEGYDIEDTGAYESAEEEIDKYLEDHPMVFDDRGNLLA